MTENLATGAGDLEFDSQVAQIGRSVTNGSPQRRRLFGAVLLKREAAEMGPPHVTRFGVISLRRI